MNRTTHRHEGELVVFLIGMTINRWWRIDQWLPTALAMPRMLRELAADPESGMLGYRLTLEGAKPTVIQYWDSVEKLYAYASDRDALHRPAWSAFNRRARKAPGVVGVWHETFHVERAESVYADTPEMGLAAATESIPVARRGDGARERLAVGRTAAS
ncbi:DUF4188 domain-containing protein [Pseudonocardia oroxyli]|uniref:DUF4188 domain-containing protein n=1 Tax=Pseudonocardia oroxyli TaxID=366584 RepID=A0A1G7LW27_PSEOR|nr:DUF4188 domain-containing protein [Pseudonocardia oroxyli]SDF53140.1 protein of unknown function [Pseudonocardia oroxyli]